MTQQIVGSKTVSQEEFSEQTMQFISNGGGQLSHSRRIWKKNYKMFYLKKKFNSSIANLHSISR